MSSEIKDYYDNLKIINALKDGIKLNREAFEETLTEDFAALKFAEDRNNELKEVITTKSKQEYEETGEKKLAHGIGIRVTSKLVYSEGEAIVWAKTNMPIAIKEVVDKKQFETFAKSNELKFVEKVESVGVTFPKEMKNE